MKSYQLAALAMLSAMAVVFQLVNDVVGLKTPFGMTVDLVGVPIVLALFLFGFEASLYVAAVTALAITFVAPTTWLGASMKFAGTMPFLMVGALIALARGSSNAGRALGAMVLAGIASLLLFFASGSMNLLAQQAGVKTVLLLGVLPLLIVLALSLLIAKLWNRFASGLNVHVFKDWRIFGIALILSILVRGVVMIVANYYFAGPLFFGMSSETLIALVPWYVIFGFNALQSVVECCAAWMLAYAYGLYMHAAW